jgi:hypothetical protein
MAKVQSSSKTLSSMLSIGSATELYKHRQSQLFRELELLLELTPSTFSSPLLALPAEIRAHIFRYVLPDQPSLPDQPPDADAAAAARPELHTCLWGADMVNGEPWRHDVFGYHHGVPKALRLHPSLLLINKQIRAELLQVYFRRSKLTLHAELRNTRTNNDVFDFSPHILLLPLLPHVTHVRFYVEWNYTFTKHAGKSALLDDQVRMTANLLQAMDTLLAPMQAVESIELSVLFFWKYRSGKMYSLAMQDLFELEDIMKRFAEARWLRVLHRRHHTNNTNNNTHTNTNHGNDPYSHLDSNTYQHHPVLTINDLDLDSDTDSPAGVGYKLSSENKALEQSGGMEVFVAPDLEYAMRYRRQSTVDYYGNYAVSDPLPEPGYRHGAMI